MSNIEEPTVSLPGGKTISLEEEIIALEVQTWEALKQEHGGQGLIPFLSTDCVMIFPGAAIFDHTSEPTLRAILNRPDVKPWSRYEMDNVRVIPIGREGATICYEVEAQRGDSTYEALISSVWRKKQDDTWELCVHQQTPINVGSSGM